MRGTPESHARARREERADCRVCSAATEARDRRVREAEWNGGGGRAKKAGNEPRSVGEDGDRDERHRA
jgi:hypothetical protein